MFLKQVFTPSVLVTISLVLAPSLLYGQQTSTLIDEHFKRFVKVEQSSFGLFDRKRATLIGESYDLLFSHRINDLSNISDHHLSVLFRAANKADFYTLKAEYRHDMRMILGELARRNVATAGDYSDLYGALIESRQFFEARRFKIMHPMIHRPPLPQYRKASNVSAASHTILTVSQTGRKLTRNAVKMKSKQIIVVSDPLCHFSRYGINDIRQSPALWAIFKSHAIWMTPAERYLYFDELQKWNKNHPAAPFVLAYNQREWPMIYTWQMPTFYFVKNGELITSVVGWPKEGRKKELKAALRKIGLLPAKPSDVGR